MKKKFTNSNNYEFSKKRQFETSDEVRTVPDQSYTVRELMERYRAGTMPAQLERNFEYDEEPTFNTSVLDTPDVDITDVIEEKRILSSKINEAKKMEAIQKAKVQQSEAEVKQQAKENADKKTAE